MKTVRPITTLFYYDGPQVFEARDGIGGHYVAVMTEPESGRIRYLVVGVAPERLRQFRTGRLDLRSLMVDGEQEWYVAMGQADFDQPLMLLPQTAPLKESGLLPDEGFMLHDSPAEDSALDEARERNNLVLDTTVDPPEAAGDHRIRVATLVGLLGHIQTLVKHAYAAALRELSSTARQAIDRSEAHLLDVVIPAAPGSFRIVLEAARTPDLLGQSELARALQKIDALFEHVADPAQALATVKAHRGHLAGAYLRLLRFLVEHRTGLRYSWAEPSSRQPSHRAVTEQEARPLVDALSGISNLGAENVQLEGAVEKVNRGAELGES